MKNDTISEYDELVAHILELMENTPHIRQLIGIINISVLDMIKTQQFNFDHNVDLNIQLKPVIVASKIKVK